MLDSQYEKDVDQEGLPAVPVHIFRSLPDTEKLDALYREITSLKQYVTDLEKKAEAMTSPAAMTDMMKNFMGGLGF